MLTGCMSMLTLLLLRSFSIPSTSVYENNEDTTARPLVRTGQYSVPKGLHGYIDTVQPTTSFMRRQNTDATQVNAIDNTASATGDCLKHSNLDCVRKQYNIDYTAAGIGSIAVAGFEYQWINLTDVRGYVKTWDPANKGTVSVKLVADGTNYESTPGAESSMDVDLAVGIGNGNPVTFLSVLSSGASDPKDDFADELLHFGQALNAETSPPSVATMSSRI
ncbi:hypothetical protein VHEMI05493 [[Torrubiella] hemipterigena]|uniref:Uncharacterized protein n=1 Tax=[Torrubiella] hemipterigena TaxID=1531966 RepID=A0A0A1TGW2_9HYPO|nr:hypothetical protein VHEMI05493 [[Torrubiella] hemipterigena]